jgi:hypothetical protein
MKEIKTAGYIEATKKWNPKKEQKTAQGFFSNDSNDAEPETVGNTNVPYGQGYPNNNDKNNTDYLKAVYGQLKEMIIDGTNQLGNLFFVTAYDKTRAYGGSEEGGWYYDVYEVIKSIGVSDINKAKLVAKKFFEEFNGTTDGKLIIIGETEQGSLVRGRPRYE